MSFFERKRREVPGLNTASLPDLIFTVLFFFMIVTHMKSYNVKVRYKVPEGTELSKDSHKASVVNVYIGAPLKANGIDSGKGTRIQVNKRIVALDEIADCIRMERDKMQPEDADRMTVAIQADRNTPMSIINAVKTELRKANALHISYTATSARIAAGQRENAKPTRR